MDRLRRLADDEQLVDVQAHGQSANSVVLVLRRLAQLAHLAEHGDGAGAGRPRPIDASALSAARIESGLAL